MLGGELSPGEMVGPYRLVERAGQGGMAEVWRAYDARLDRHVAIKFRSRRYAAETGYLERFQREARAISRLDHPNILPVFDFASRTASPTWSAPSWMAARWPSAWAGPGRSPTR